MGLLAPPTFADPGFKGTLTMEGQGPVVDVDALLVGTSGEIMLNNDGTAVNQLRVVDGPAATFRDGSRLTYNGDANYMELLHGLGVTEAPTLRFLGAGGLIGRTVPPDPDANLLVGNMYNIDIESEVSGPALEWDTTGVDLSFKPEFPVELEVISPDNCNIMFVDANGDLFPPSPCIKYWRSIRLVSNPVDLVNNHPNHAPFGECPAAAVYLVDSLKVGNPGPFDLQGHAVYYGGGLTLTGGSITDSVTGTPRYADLLKTKYGDFDGDCDIDLDDRAVLIEAWTGLGVVTDYPLADADGDCDVDVFDVVIWNANVGTELCWCDELQTYCDTPDFPLDCPAEEYVHPDCPGPIPDGGGGDGLLGGTLEVWPAGGTTPLTVLESETTYELHYPDADYPTEGYILFVATDNDESGISAAGPADVGPWSNTGNCAFHDLETEADALMPALGFPDGFAYHQLVVDQQPSAQDGEPVGGGFLCTFTTKGPGELGLYLMLERSTGDGPVLGEASATFTVMDAGGETP
ncbi:MAG: hypothetical protein IH988_06995 [Planctomycetes bacterium]|nr:hypothetical protein [Planctomycetota bacterium]